MKSAVFWTLTALMVRVCIPSKQMIMTSLGVSSTQTLVKMYSLFDVEYMRQISNELGMKTKIVRLGTKYKCLVV